MRHAETLLGLPEFSILKIKGTYKTKVVLEVETKKSIAKCPRCKKKTNKIDHRYTHTVRDNFISGKAVYLKIRKKVFYCHPCDYSFTELVDSVAHKRIYTKRFEITVFENCLENTISSVARNLKLPYDCVRGIYDRIADICIEHLMKQKNEIEILGIDEIAVRKGHKNYQAIVSNISGGHVIDVLPDRKQATVVEFLRKMPVKARKRVVFVSIDMWDGYFNAAQQVLPHTLIVIDRFHVMKNLNDAITRARRRVQRNLPKAEKDKYKGYRWLLVKNEENMTDDELSKLSKMLNECPELKSLYDLRVEFQTIFNRTRITQVADKKLRTWEKKVSKLDDKDMDIFLNLLSNWREWILNYFVSKKVTNAFVEGMNNKIKLIKRTGYGYRSKVNFRKKVLVECGYNNLPKSQKLLFLRNS